MSRIHVHSTYPPAIWTRLDGRRVLAAGTITKIVDGDTSYPADIALPPDLALDWFVHVPRHQPVAQPQIVRVPGSRGQTYIVTRYSDGTTSCTCLGYIYRRTCKHLQHLTT
jgi:hypothetical protein